MEPNYDQLYDRAIQLLENTDQYRIIILLIGAPGTGKTTVANKLVDKLNKEYNKRQQNKQQREYKLINSKYKTTQNIDIEEYFEDTLKDLPVYEKDDFNPLPEDDSFKPRKYKYNENKYSVIGRGGLKYSQIELSNDKAKDSTESNTSNQFNNENVEFAKRISMDGFHLPRELLSRFKDPQEAFDKRGSPKTFDPYMVSTLSKLLKDTCRTKIPSEIWKRKENKRDVFFTLGSNVTGIPTIRAPDFNHELKDPTLNGITIDSHPRVLVFEGLYLLLNKPIWSNIYSSFQNRLTLSTLENCKKSLKKAKSTTTTSPSHIANFRVPTHNTRKRLQFYVSVQDDSMKVTTVNPGHIYYKDSNTIVNEPTERENVTSEVPTRTTANERKSSSLATLKNGVVSEFWKIEVLDGKITSKRVAKRHLDSKIVESLDEGYKRYFNNDKINGDLVDNSSFEPDLLIDNSK
ncbi:hypothetical protein BVG19_g1558 [[Candida] boidinii]|nr:hypothetical protein BVG19_g1558 [[Candida] boidinii]OWB50305.1 hypothetical protein B5S27_g1854 [[Candida] boidinii]